MTRPRISIRRTLIKPAELNLVQLVRKLRVVSRFLAGKQVRTPPIEFLAGKQLEGVATQPLARKELGNSKSFGEWKLRTIEQQIGPNVSYCFGRRDERLRGRHQAWQGGCRDSTVTLEGDASRSFRRVPTFN